MTAGGLGTYARIWKTFPVTRSLPTARLPASDGYLGEFCEFWSARSEARKIWFSLFTPRKISCARSGSAEDRVRAVSEIAQLRTQYAKVDMPQAVLDGLAPSRVAAGVHAQVPLASRPIWPPRFRPVIRRPSRLLDAGASLLLGWPRSDSWSTRPGLDYFRSLKKHWEQCRCEN